MPSNWELFRDELESILSYDKRDGTRRLFEQFGKLLSSEGLLAKEGSIVDASFVAAPRQRNSREENQDIKDGKRPAGFESDSPKGRQKDCAASVHDSQVFAYNWVDHLSLKPSDLKIRLLILVSAYGVILVHLLLALANS